MTISFKWLGENGPSASFECAPVTHGLTQVLLRGVRLPVSFILEACCPVEHDCDWHGTRSVGRIGDQEALTVAGSNIMTTHGLVLEPCDRSGKQRLDRNRPAGAERIRSRRRRSRRRRAAVLPGPGIEFDRMRHRRFLVVRPQKIRSVTRQPTRKGTERHPCCGRLRHRTANRVSGDTGAVSPIHRSR